MKKNIDSFSFDLIETVTTRAKVSKGHKILIDSLSGISIHDLKFMAARGDMFTGKCSVFDADHNEVASDYRKWLVDQVAACGNARSVYDKYRDSGYLISETPCQLLYFSLPYGDSPGEFFQFEFYLSHEVIARKLFDNYAFGMLKDVEDLISNQGGRLEIPVTIADERYSFSNVRDVFNVVAEINDYFKDRLRLDGEKIFDLTNIKTGVTRSSKLSELHPEAYSLSQNSGAYRFFQDWAESSAGRSGANVQDHWYFHIWDRTANGRRDLGLIPGWTTTKRLAEVEAKPANITDYAIYDKLLKIDQRVGVPFAWYFFMLHGNRVKDWAGMRIVNAVEQGYLVLPDHDYLVLKRWSNNRYGF